MKLPRFNLRELFLLVVIAAMGCGWWASLNAQVAWIRQYSREDDYGLFEDDFGRWHISDFRSGEGR